MSDLRPARSSPVRSSARLRRGWLFVPAVVVAVAAALAWVDGGERPLRPISETIELGTASGGQN